MKRSIQILVTRINQDANGELTGGFGHIKGGIKQLPANNDVCTNGSGGTGSCSGTNSLNCTNEGDCSNGTNKTTCSNGGTCFF